MSKKRMQLSDDLIQQVLLNSRRRCCVCHAEGRDDVQQGNITYLRPVTDRDFIETEDNLVFLCHHHHKLLDEGSLNAEHVRTARENLYRAFSEPPALTESDASTPWIRYERKVYDLIKAALDSQFPGLGNVHYNRAFTGRSGLARDMTITISANIIGIHLLIAVEAKYSKQYVSVLNVESFLGKLQDVGANKGIFVTNTGFTESATRIAKSAGIALATIKEEDNNFQAGILLDSLGR